jgi:hypothetical protein
METFYGLLKLWPFALVGVVAFAFIRLGSGPLKDSSPNDTPPYTD